MSAQQIDSDVSKLLYYVCTNYCKQLHDDLRLDSDRNRRWYKGAIIDRFARIFPFLFLLLLFSHVVMIFVFVIDVMQKFTNNNNKNNDKSVNPIRVPRTILGLLWWCDTKDFLVFHFTAIESELKTIWNSIAFSGEKQNQTRNVSQNKRSQKVRNRRKWRARL